MTETIDHETGEIITTTQPSVPAVRHAGMPTPYQSADTGQLAQALATVQGEMESPKKTKEGKIEGVAKVSGKSYSFEYKYAPFEEIVRVIKNVFPKHGLMYQQGLVVRGDQYFIRTYIRHSSGEWTASDYPVIADKGGPQGFASASTYAKRYGLSLAVGLAAEDDDDGAAAQKAAPEARAAGKTAAKAPTRPADDDLTAQARQASEEGVLPLRLFAASLTRQQKNFLGAGFYQECLARATEVDREAGEFGEQDPPGDLADPPHQDADPPKASTDGEGFPSEREYRI